MPVKNNQRADRGANRKAGNESKAESWADKRARLAKELKLAPKTVQLIELLENNPKLTQAEAYSMLHNVKDSRVAAANASRVLASDSARIYKDSAVRKAKKKIVSLIDSDNEQIAIKASQDVLDRTEGKATQKTEQTSRTVHVSLDLTGVRIGSHYLPTSNK